MPITKEPKNWYDPGNPIRFSIKTFVLGNLTDAPAIVFKLFSPDGSVIEDNAPVHEGSGVYHSDIILPLDARDGKWPGWWQSTGNQPAQNLHKPVLIGVNKLDH